MQKDPQSIISQSKVKHTLSNFAFHSFVMQKKQLLSEGNCLILQVKKDNEENAGTSFIRFNNYDYCKKINKEIFIKVKYERSISYLFFEENNNNIVYSVSSNITNNDCSFFQGLITQNATLMDYQSESLNFQIKDKINQHIEKIMENQIIINWNKTSKIAKGIGSLFGIISEKIVKVTHNADKSVNQKVDRFSKDNFSEQTHSKWASFKNKASELNNKLAIAVKPIAQSVESAFKDIHHSVQMSDNKYIKGIRQFTNEAQLSLNEGFNSQQVVQLKQQKPASSQSQDSQNKSAQLQQQPSQYPML